MARLPNIKSQPLSKHRSLPELDLKCPIHASVARGRHTSEPVMVFLQLYPHGRAVIPLERLHDVATATYSPRPSNNNIQFSQAGSGGHHLDPLSLSSDTTSSSQQPPASVDRPLHLSSSIMTITKSSRNVKAFRRNMVVGLNANNDTKRQSLSNDFNDSHSSTIPKLRSIRRKLSITRTGPNNPDEPIAISLTLSSSPTTSPPPPTSPSRTSTASESESPTNDESPVTEPTPLKNLPPSQNANENEPTSSPSSISVVPAPPSSYRPSTPMNVRIGHPSRPYYSVIRKNGISPPSSRRPSITDYCSSPPPTSPSATRPKSYTPPLSSGGSGGGISKSAPATITTAQRHMSMSALPHSAAHIFSAFALDDDNDDDNSDSDEVIIAIVDENTRHGPIRPRAMPSSSRLSLGTSIANAVAKSLTRKRSASLNTTLGFQTTGASTSTLHAHRRNSHSVTNPSLVLPLPFSSPPPPAAPPPPTSSPSPSLLLSPEGSKGKGFRMSRSGARHSVSGIGFSVSGETELKMALAFSEATKQAEAEGAAGGGGGVPPRIMIDTGSTAMLASPSTTTTTMTTQNEGFNSSSLLPIMPASSSVLFSSPSPSSQQIPTTTGHEDSSSKNSKSLASRVRRLRKGLKEMLSLSSSNGNGNGNGNGNSTAVGNSTGVV